MSAPELEGHGPVLNGLWRAARENRLPHAFLFEGPAGIGKFLAARRFAQGLFCERGPGEPCDRCGPCKRVLSGGWTGNHPDLFVIDPVEEGSERIKVARIAERSGDEESAESFLALRPAEGGWRALLIREAHRMNPEAQNALLKTLEEPSDSTLIVLESDRPHLLFDTIRSRCVRVRFDSLEQEASARILAEHGLERGQALALTRWGQGSPGRALELLGVGAPAMRELLGGVLAGGLDPLAAADSLWTLPGEFSGRTESAKARSRARSFLDLGLAVVSDLARAGAGIPAGQLAHGDLVEGLRGAPAGPIEAAVERALESLMQSRRDIDSNLAPDAAVERCLLVLAGCAGLPSPGSS